ncbi:hypothetical protein Y032_0009g464 [Ancylostoma ceylanicum]|uniref:Uncharacterized protein n=1 Tax=Ancylostoma ceylanicum TaxID=53326 RepID=A0A016VIZ6_9BILA|nr:hypothetical protein Y032_0009g464 [Ancylostoma ceylanicum]
MVVLIVSCLSGSRGLAKYDETFGRVVYRKNAGTTFRPLKKTVLVETFKDQRTWQLLQALLILFFLSYELLLVSGTPTMMY